MAGPGQAPGRRLPMAHVVNRFSLAAFIAIPLAIGCYADGADEDKSSAPVCLSAPKFAAGELATPEVAFDTQVAPLFVDSCSFSACHASKLADANHGLFLKGSSAETIAKVKESLTAKSKALPSMPYVTPGDPENSFLMRKMDADLCTLADQCTDKDCGKSMPSGNDVLPADARNLVRRWIAQGAK